MKRGPHVTDHALLRYLERRYGVDVAALREQIRLRVRPAAKMGARGVSIDGVYFVIRNGRVVTTLRRSPTLDHHRRGLRR